MCEYKEIKVETESLPRIYWPKMSKNMPETYLASIQRRTRVWVNQTSEPHKNKFHEFTSLLNLNEDQKQKLWMIICYCHLHLISPLAFFDFLAEIAVEERVRLTSFASAEKLRAWPKNPIPATFQDNFLVFVYLAIRDGLNAYVQLENLDNL